ncbi:MAG TPA: DsbA family protein [Candidatus Paceibacterota bacterium]
MQKEYLLPVSILAAGVLIAGSVLYSTGITANKKGATADLDTVLNQDSGAAVSLSLNAEDVVLGDPKAPVTLIEYADFQCPFCGRFYSQVMPKIKENFVKNKEVKIVYRHFAFLGPESVAAAEASECAKDQGKFWEYHNALYDAEVKDGKEHNGNLNETFFMSLAAKLGLNVSNFSQCVTDQKYKQKVEDDYTGALKVGVAATPTSFINGTKVEGALPYSQFEPLLKQAIQASQ